jgi:hypothetical protein
MNAAISKTTLMLSLSALLIGASAMARADETKFDKDHPRRAEVNGRLANQDKRIHQEVKEGEMSKAKAAKLHKEDHQIRQEERTMASHDGGHITKADQRSLNQQENAVSHQIGH